MEGLEKVDLFLGLSLFPCWHTPESFFGHTKFFLKFRIRQVALKINIRENILDKIHQQN
jgi:hypothetical protein